MGIGSTLRKWLVKKDLEIILSYLREERGFDFSGYRPVMLERRIMQRFSFTGCRDRTSYLEYLKTHSDELDELVDALTINVSRFFRNTLVFEYLAGKILPLVVKEKAHLRDASLRIWSAGCSYGEEPYSMAILIKELFHKEDPPLALNLFGTDIDEKALKKAEAAIYPFESIQGIKYGLLKRYFKKDGDLFRLMPEIREMVDFSVFDMVGKKGDSPPLSVFGNFDIILCKNLLIYFSTPHQEKVFGKLYRSLAGGGYLVLGRTEIPTGVYGNRLRKINECCPIYQKV